MIGSGSIAFGAVYLYMKNEAKKRESLGKNFLDSQTILGDMEMAEQIGIEGYEYVILPEATIEGNEICYEKMDLDVVSQALASPYIRFGGESTLRPNVVDRLVENRLLELKEEAENRVRERLEREENGKRPDDALEMVPISDLPKKKFWQRRGSRKGLTKIGDSTPEFTTKKVPVPEPKVEEEEFTKPLFSPIKRKDDDE